MKYPAVTRFMRLNWHGRRAPTRLPSSPLPSSLAELVRARLERLDPGVHDILLAAACVTAPTVDLVASATSINSQRALELLEDAEYKQIVEIDGLRLSFTHLLLARG